MTENSIELDRIITDLEHRVSNKDKTLIYLMKRMNKNP